jgi:hypothetical protein
MNARPHPGPLPQERGNDSPFSGEADASGYRTYAEANDTEAAFATVADNFSSTPAALSLSSGERAGVRASLDRYSRFAVVAVLGAPFGLGNFSTQ